MYLKPIHREILKAILAELREHKKTLPSDWWQGLDRRDAAEVRLRRELAKEYQVRHEPAKWLGGLNEAGRQAASRAVTFLHNSGFITKILDPRSDRVWAVTLEPEGIAEAERLTQEAAKA